MQVPTACSGGRGLELMPNLACLTSRISMGSCALSRLSGERGAELLQRLHSYQGPGNM